MPHISEYLRSFALFTKITLACALTLIFYGYLSRWLDIYFFWESMSIGYTLLIIGLISLLADGIRIKKHLNKKTLLNKIGIGVMVFFLVLEIIFAAVIPHSMAYKTAKEHIKSDPELIKELGEINSFGLIPTGGIEISNDSGGEYGSANFNMIIKGQKKYKEVSVFVVKNVDTDWKVTAIE